ncbi:hypothetical protein TNCV_2893511 [Trichonephila clavipes]|nr:hypothetical protein TNCV_2893511 [Trichonephila clavipes]
MRKKPKTGEGRGNKRRQSQPGRDVGGAKHETGRNGQNDKRHGRERTEAGAAKEGNKESEQNKIRIEFGCRGDPRARFAIGRLALFLLVERKQLRLISGRGILSLCTPPPAEAGVMWRVRLGSRVFGELKCRYR